jgi:rubrerythrin
MAEVLDIVQFIRKLALIEAEGVGFYRSLAEHADDEKIRKLSRMMARAEQAHQEGFEDLAATLEKRKKVAPPSKIPSDLRQYILTLIDHRIFLSPEQAATLARNVSDLNEAVDIAIKFEKENILLLQECRAISGGSTKKLLEKIIDQERKHIVGLQRARKALALAK